MLKFDLKSGYYHLYIMKLFKLTSDFRGKLIVKSRHFVFTVLPFGLNSALFLFTNIVRHLAKYWRRHPIKKIACFLDDGLSVTESFSEAICNSEFIQETLQNLILL